MEALLTIPQAAKVLRISAKTCYEWAARGWIPASRLGRSIRVSPTKLERFLDEHPVCQQKRGFHGPGK